MVVTPDFDKQLLITQFGPQRRTGRESLPVPMKARESLTMYIPLAMSNLV